MKKITFLLFLTCVFYKVQAQGTTIYYDDFRFPNDSGYQGYITSNPGSIPDGTLITRPTDLPDETAVLGYTRPANNIGDRTDLKDQRLVSLVGHAGGVNHTATTWCVTDPVDISSSPNMIITFALRNRFITNDGDADPNFKILIATDYTFGTDPSTVTWTDITAQSLRISNDAPFSQNPNWHHYYYNASTHIGSSGSDKFSLAFQAEFSAGINPFSSSNRNGNWYISDVRYIENSTLSTNSEVLNNTISVYPNPVNDILNITNAQNVKIKSVNLINVLGKTVYTSTTTEAIDVSPFSKGVYLLRMISETNEVSLKKIIIE